MCLFQIRKTQPRPWSSQRRNRLNPISSFSFAASLERISYLKERNKILRPIPWSYSRTIGMILSGLEWRMLMNFCSEKCEPIIIATSYAFTQRNDFIPVCVCVCGCVRAREEVCETEAVHVWRVCVWGRGGDEGTAKTIRNQVSQNLYKKILPLSFSSSHTRHLLTRPRTRTHSQKFITKLIASIDNCNNLNFKLFLQSESYVKYLTCCFLSYWTLVMDFVAFRGIWESISRASQTTRIPVYNHHLCLLDTNNIITPCSFSKSKTCSTALEKNIMKQNKARLSRDGLSFVDLTTLQWNFDCQFLNARGAVFILLWQDYLLSNRKIMLMSYLIKSYSFMAALKHP